jgi:hypothetical protein
MNTPLTAAVMKSVHHNVALLCIPQVVLLLELAVVQCDAVYARSDWITYHTLLLYNCQRVEAQHAAAAQKKHTALDGALSEKERMVSKCLKEEHNALKTTLDYK